MSNVLTGIVTETRIGLYEMAGFMYHIAHINAAKLKDLVVLIPVTKEVEVGDYIQSYEYTLTRITTETLIDEFVIRFGKVEVITEEEYIPCDYVRVKCFGLYTASETGHIKTVGHSKKQMFLATLKIKDDKGKFSYPILLVAFCKIAPELYAIPKQTKMEIEGCLNRMKYREGYELNISSFTIVSPPGNRVEN